MPLRPPRSPQLGSDRGLRHDYFNWEPGNVACACPFQSPLGRPDEALADPQLGSGRDPRVAGHDYFNWEPGNVACIPMIETTEALSNLDEILAVPGIDAIYVRGPA